MGRVGSLFGHLFRQNQRARYILNKSIMSNRRSNFVLLGPACAGVGDCIGVRADDPTRRNRAISH